MEEMAAGVNTSSENFDTEWVNSDVVTHCVQFTTLQREHVSKSNTIKIYMIIVITIIVVQQIKN